MNINPLDFEIRIGSKLDYYPPRRYTKDPIRVEIVEISNTSDGFTTYYFKYMINGCLDYSYATSIGYFKQPLIEKLKFLLNET